jgi:hypothetical protein
VDLVQLRPQPLRRDLRDHERGDVEVLEAHDVPAGAARSAASSAVTQRVVGLPHRRDRAADRDHDVREGVS